MGRKAVLISLTEFFTPEKVLSTGVQQIVATWKKEVKSAVGINRAVRLVEAAKISIGIEEGLRMAKKELEDTLEQYELYLKQNEQIEMEILVGVE